jgi:hypothetical protein
MQPVGTKIALTMSKVLDREEYVAMANHPNKVFEVFIEPETSKTKGGQSLWLYPTFGIVSETTRNPKLHSVSAKSFLMDLLGGSQPAALPQNGAPLGNANA